MVGVVSAIEIPPFSTSLLLFFAVLLSPVLDGFE